MSRAPEGLLASTSTVLLSVRERTPLVHCMTNTVVMNFTANVLLAVGASPAMVDVPGEAGPFASIAGGVLVNLGTPGAEQRQAMLEAVPSAKSAGVPWVLDPVAVGALSVRTPLARQLSGLGPAIIRGNASEVIALAGTGSGGRGVDATDSVEGALSAARALARATGAVVAVSGAVDLITDGDELTRVANGDALLTRVTGGGCALGAVMTAFAAVADDPYVAAVAATAVYTVAAEIAAAGAPGPGSFAVRFVDALAAVDAAVVAKEARIS